MSLLSWDYDELAFRVQTGLDRLSVGFFRGHGARVRRDEMDFHGFEHLDLEVLHDGHRLHVQQYARVRGVDAPLDPTEPLPTEEFHSTFDDAPARTLPADQLAAWLASLPAGEAVHVREAPSLDPTNPFAPPSRDAPSAPARNPFLSERPSAAAGPNPFAPPAADDQRRRALDWLRDDD